MHTPGASVWERGTAKHYWHCRVPPWLHVNWTIAAFFHSPLPPIHVNTVQRIFALGRLKAYPTLPAGMLAQLEHWPPHMQRS